MARKSFKEINPALEYITTDNKLPAEPERAEPARPDVKLDEIIEAVQQTENKQEEKRDKRISLAIQPSLHEDLLIATTLYRTNLNDLCNSILTEYVNGKRDNIDKFKAMSSQMFLK